MRVFEKKKRLNYSSHDYLDIYLDDDFIVVQEINNEWPKLFDTFFLSPTTRLAQTSTGATSDDDLVFYVTRKMPNESQPASVNKFKSKRIHLFLYFSDSIW